MSTATAPTAASTEHPTTAGDERAYRAKVAEISAELAQLDVKSINLAWERACKAYYAIAQLEKDFDKPKEQMYEDLAHGNTWAAQTIKKAILTCGRLEKIGFTDVFNNPASGFTQVTDILNAKKLSDEARKKLLTKVYKHDKKDAAQRHTVQEVRAMIKDLSPPEEKGPDWMRGTDLWSFSDHDERFGVAGFPGRLPGQAFMNLIHRFTTGHIHALHVGCGGGTMLDVCAKSELKGRIGKQFRGVDIKLHPQVTERYLEHAIEADCTADLEHWDRVCAPEWADLVVVTLPLFSFMASARTGEPTDLGNVNDPELWLAMMRKAIVGAYSRLNVQGILAVHSASSSCFENNTPVPDLDFGIIQTIQELTDFFEARIVLEVKKGKPKASPADANWVTPQAEYLHVYRKI